MRGGLRGGLLGGLGFSLMMLLAFEPVGWWWAGLLAVAPLMLAARARGGARSLGLWAGVGSGVFWAWSHQWVWTVSAAGMLPLVLMLSVCPGVFVWVMARRARRGRGEGLWAGAVLWGALEWVRGEAMFGGYAWYFNAHPLIEAPGGALAWPAAWVGVYPVCVLAALVSGLVVGIMPWAEARRPKRRAGLAVAVALLVSWVGWGIARHEESTAGETVRVGVVQTNVPQSNKSSWSETDRVLDTLRFEKMTEEAAGEGVDLIVWPETMFAGKAIDPVSLRAERAAAMIWELDPGLDLPELILTTDLADLVLELSDRVRTPMILGAAGYEGLGFETRENGLIYPLQDKEYNSAFLLDDGAVAGPAYHKLRLTPFGEVMPYISWWPWLESRLLAVGASGMTFTLSPGDRPVALEVPVGARTLGVATPICFEVSSAGVCRRLVFDGLERRAGVMVNLTNDGWFGGWDAGRMAHLQTARWRCLELGTPMVRAANTGISCVIDARGRVTHGGPGWARREGVLIGEAVIAGGRTGSVRWGGPAGAAIGLGGLWVLAGTVLGGRKM